VPPGQTVRLTVQSGSGDLTLTLEARVIRIAGDDKSDDPPMGIEFGPIDDTDRPTLEALISRVVEGVAPASLQNLSAQSSAAEIRRALESISLGHRIALAGRAMPREREMLMHDTQMQVIDALARNPLLLLHEVQSVLRMPCLLPHTLDTLARDPKWKSNESIKVMIATHTNASLALAQRLVDTLGPEGKRKVLQSSGLKPALRIRLVKSGHGGPRR
jgi:hypothetical protein